MSKKQKIILIVSVIIIILGLIALAILFPLSKKKATDEAQQTEVDETISTDSGTLPASTTTETTETPDTEFLKDDLGESNVDNLLDNVPYFTEDFSVEYKADSQKFIITLYPIINHDWQKDQYLSDLKTFKYEALEWISQFGVNIYDINIEYVPEEAKDL